MDFKNIPQQSEKLIGRMTNAVEKTGKKVASEVSHLTNSNPEEVTEEAIQTAVDKAIDVLKIAEQKVREKNINSDTVTLEVGVNVVNIAQLKITTNVPGEDEQ